MSEEVELCAKCDQPINGLRVLVPMFGFMFGPYCSGECAPEPPPRKYHETWNLQSWRP